MLLNKYDRTNIKGLRDSLINLNIDLINDIFQIKRDLLNFSSNKNIENIFLNENTQIIGGDKREKKFEKWIETIKIFNSNIIECTNIIEAKNILPIELRKKLKIPLQLVECKYLARKKYFEYLNSLKEIKLDKEKGYNDISKGICFESDIPKIYKQKIKIFVEETLSNFGISRKEISESFNDIIVGFKIVSQRNDDYNGEWKIYFNPLLKKEINIRFASQFVRE